jgi:mannosyl-oligosaccharide alpha-1,2-mannosidase
MVGDINTRKMYDDAMNAFVDNGFMKTSPQSNLLYIAEERNDVKVGNVGHLTCFAGGMFALGAHVDPNNQNSERDAEIGRNFTNTCRESYIRSTTGIGPEVFQFTDDLEAIGSPNVGRNYLLRPEVIESYFIMWRITGDSKYRDWGWDAAVAIEKYCKAGQGGGYSGINNVYDENPSKNDVQETFFLAETLKVFFFI